MRDEECATYVLRVLKTVNCNLRAEIRWLSKKGIFYRICHYVCSKVLINAKPSVML